METIECHFVISINFKFKSKSNLVQIQNIRFIHAKYGIHCLKNTIQGRIAYKESRMN